MGLYKLKTDTNEYDLSVIENHAFGNQQSIIIYEAPGNNGGTIKNNGRLTKKVALNGKYISQLTNVDAIYADLTNFQEEMEAIEDQGQIVTLLSPISNGTTGKYIISNFDGNYVGGTLKHISFTLELIENKQSNIKRNAVNLVNYQPAQFMKELGRQRQVS